MKNFKIVPLRAGYSNAVLIANGENSVIVDTGVQGFVKVITGALRRFGLKPTDIRLIILTHTHRDHTGNLPVLKEMTGAQVIVHKNEFLNLKNGFTPVPAGISRTTRIISGIGRTIIPRFASPVAFDADIVTEGEYPLQSLGIDGKIIPTPGHTNGSQSVLVGEKLISGDTFINLKKGTVFPHFCNDPELLISTWENLFEKGIKEIYPGHGARFSVDRAWPDYNKWKQKTAGKNTGCRHSETT